MAGLYFTLAVALALSLPAAQRAGVQREESGLARLERWVATIGRAGTLPGADLAEAEAVLYEVERAWKSRPGEAREIARPVLDFLGHFLVREHAGIPRSGPDLAERRARERATQLLQERAPEIRGWLAREVLPLSRAHPIGRRLGAARTLAQDPTEEALLALFTATRAPERAVRDEAVLALAGRELEAVHTLFAGLLESSIAGRVELRKGPLERHLRELELAPWSTAHERVLAYVRRALAAEDWRDASRAVSVSRCLHPSTAVPLLIDALALWHTRGAAGQPSRRIQGELQRELERISRRRLGLDSERWRAWWAAVEAGEISLDGSGERLQTVAQPGFFGLRPMTDRVTFVLDRSGSMNTPFGPYSGTPGRPGRTRIQEAAAQMKTCLELLGPETHFNVVVFSDGASAWQSRLQPAKPSHVEAAASWVLRLGASGGTRLRAGVEAAMHIEGSGLPRLADLDADTIVLLCDGATAEGPGWVRPFLERANDDARVVFHAVRIAAPGDGALDALCELSGGELVHVDG